MHHFLLLLETMMLFGTYSAQDDEAGIVLTVLPLTSNGIMKIRIIPTTPYEDFNGTIPGVYFHDQNTFLGSCDIDVRRKRIFIKDSYTNTLLVGINFDPNVSHPDLKFLYTHYGITRDLTDFSRIAYDWLADNIYWTDPGYKWIGVQAVANDNSLNHMYRIIVREHLSRPVGIAVDPINRWLFWTDTGLKKIERSDLAGRFREPMVVKSLSHPSALVADISEERIYWVDSVRETIESVAYNKTDRRLVRRITGTEFYDVALFREVLMVTDIRDDGWIRLVDKNTGEYRYHTLALPLEKSYGISMYHGEVQPDGQNDCVSSICSDICVNDHSFGRGYQCLCRMGYSLDTDHKNCLEDKSKLQHGLLIANKTSICIVDIRVLSVLAYPIYDPVCIYNHDNNTDIGDDGIVFLEYDAKRKAIIFATSVKVFLLNMDQENPESTVIFEAIGTISGISYDWIDAALYITDNSAGIIYYLSMKTYSSYEVLTAFDNPKAILVVPLERKIFWISGSTGNYTIDSLDLDEEEGDIVVESSLLLNPKDLSYDAISKRIVWTDGSKVVSCNYDGTDIGLIVTTPQEPYLIHVHQDYLLWLTEHNGLIYISSEHLNGDHSISNGFFADMPYISDLIVIDEYKQPNKSGPCDNPNTPCDQICLSVQGEAKCHCEFGFQEKENLCFTNPVPGHFVLLADGTHNRIYQVDLVTEVVHAVNTHEEVAAVSVLYNPGEGTVLWSSQRDTGVLEMNLDGTNRRSMGYIDDVVIEAFTIDITFGNIYFAAISEFARLGYSFSYIGVMSPEGLYAKLITGLREPMGVVIHPEDGLLFYSERQGTPYIGKAYMDGSNVSQLITEDIIDPRGLAIDHEDWYYDRIESADFDGHRTIIFEDLGADLIALGLDADYFYYIGWNRPHISRVSKSNSTSATIIASNAEFGKLESIFVYSHNYVTPLHNDVCKDRNGKAICSTFCFPSNNSFVCACQENVKLKSDNRTCEDVFQCNDTIPNGSLNPSCLRYTGTNCTYTCNYGFKAHVVPAQLTCVDEDWDIPDPCEEIFCSNKSNQVIIAEDCDLKVGSRCSYECQEGFSSVVDGPSSLTCRDDESWSPPTENLCDEISCKNESGQVTFDDKCDLRVGSTCKFECLDGYKKTPGVPAVLKCNINGSWSEDTDNLCQAIPPTSEEQSSSDSVVAPAVGGSVGALVLICILLLLLCILLRRYRRGAPRAERLESIRSVPENDYTDVNSPHSNDYDYAEIASHHSRSSIGPLNRQEANTQTQYLQMNNPAYGRGDAETRSNFSDLPQYMTIGSVNTVFSALSQNGQNDASTSENTFRATSHAPSQASTVHTQGQRDMRRKR